MKTRFDYLGLSTDDKPTNEAVNGSTFKEVDTSKLYIFYNGEWYEKESSGGGGADLSLYFKPTIKKGTQYVQGLSSMILTIPETTTVEGDSLDYAFTLFTSLTSVPLLDTSNVTSMLSMFDTCIALETIPLLDTSKVTNFRQFCADCYALKNVPILDTSSATNMLYMFKSCSELTNDSLNNILKMCINATAYTGTKTLQIIGLSGLQATTCQGLSNYDDFIASGWTTGY